MSNAPNEQSSVDRVPLKLVAAFFTVEDWPHEQIGDQLLLRTTYKGQRSDLICFAHCRPDHDQFVFYSVAPARVPESVRSEVAEFLTRANSGMILGNFELDYGDGEVRFKTSIQMHQTNLTANLLRPLIYGNVAAMDKYLPGLASVIAQEHTPSEAVAAVENG